MPNLFAAHLHKVKLGSTLFHCQLSPEITGSHGKKYPADLSQLNAVSANLPLSWREKSAASRNHFPASARSKIQHAELNLCTMILYRKQTQCSQKCCCGGVCLRSWRKSLSNPVLWTLPWQIQSSQEHRTPYWHIINHAVRVRVCTGVLNQNDWTLPRREGSICWIKSPDWDRGCA